MSPSENKSLIHRLYDEGINRQDAAAAAGFYAADAINHRRVIGRAGMQRVFEALFATFPDFHYAIENETADGERVVCKVMMTGTHLGQPTMPEIFHGMLNGVAATGKRVQVLQYHDFRLRGGQIAEHAAVRDDLGMLLQLGSTCSSSAGSLPASGCSCMAARAAWARLRSSWESWKKRRC